MKITLESKITVKEAYLVMYEFLDRYWNDHNKPDEIGDILSNLSLWECEDGSLAPMDGAVFPEFLNCTLKVISEEKTNEGYRDADI